jgi:hypothetical protein
MASRQQGIAINQARNAQMSFYAWIRESVKRAVLLGLSDAIEQIGTPVEGDASHEKLLASLRQHVAIEAKVETAAPGRKRLGKSLDQISAQARPATT